MPIVLSLGLGAADLAIHAIYQTIAQNAAASIAGAVVQGVPLDDPVVIAELDRACKDGTIEAAGDVLLVVTMTCPTYTVTTLLPDHVVASASAASTPAPTESPSGSPAP